jgi:hypothetical protein
MLVTQTNCLECSVCYDFEETGIMVSLCQEPECRDESEQCKCGHVRVDHYNESVHGPPE